MQETVLLSNEQRVADFINRYQNTYKATVENYKIFIERDGIKVELHLISVGYNGSYDIAFSRYKYRDNISRIVGGREVRINMKKFMDQAKHRIDEALTEQIIAPAKQKSGKQTEKVFSDWKKTNELFLTHENVKEVTPKMDYREETPISYGTDVIITKLKAYGGDKIPTNTQLFGVIVKSGIKVHEVRNNEVSVIGNGEETTKFLKLLNSPLEW